MLSTIDSEHIQRFKKFIRYGLASGLTYAYALSGIYVLNHYELVDAKYTYGLVYLTLYIIQYPLLIKFVYQVEFKSKFVYRYAVFLLLNWIVSSILFSSLLDFGFGVLWAFIVVTCVMFPIRFFIGMKIYK